MFQGFKKETKNDVKFFFKYFYKRKEEKTNISLTSYSKEEFKILITFFFSSFLRNKNIMILNLKEKKNNFTTFAVTIEAYYSEKLLRKSSCV